MVPLLPPAKQSRRRPHRPAWASPTSAGSTAVSHLLDEALDLPANERSAWAAALLDSLDGADEVPRVIELQVDE